MFYAPRLSHAAWSIVACMFFVALGEFVPARLKSACYVGSIGFALLTALIMIWMFIRMGDDRIERMESFARTFATLDEEGRAAFSFQFPTMRYRIRRGRVREMFEDTQVTMEQFRLFLQDSTRRAIAPERNWNSTERPRAAWLEVKDWLETNDYILPDSAAGSHSWLWYGNSYDHLMAYWMSGRKVPDLSEMENA